MYAIPTAKNTPVPLISPLNEKGKAGKEFDKVYEAYVNYLDESNMVHLLWRKLYPDLPKDALDPRTHLQKLDMKPLMEHLMKQNAKLDNCFGYLPLMCGFSPVQLGALVAQNFSERMNSAGNLLVTKHRLKTDGDLFNALVCLRVNKRFMKLIMANINLKSITSMESKTHLKMKMEKMKMMCSPMI